MAVETHINFLNQEEDHAFWRADMGVWLVAVLCKTIQKFKRVKKQSYREVWLQMNLNSLEVGIEFKFIWMIFKYLVNNSNSNFEF